MARLSASRRKRVSKYLSSILRHRPEVAGITLDAEGWADVDAILAALDREGLPSAREDLDEVIDTNDKQRFSLDVTGTRIRAAQGHSVDVDLKMQPVEPPELLYHGTVERFLDSIRADGLRKGSRQYVHLSPDEATARSVGGRRGDPVILTVYARRMHAVGHAFYRSDNGVWLTDHVPPSFLALR